ncbi:pentatricopeptide repeat protein [Aspergillus foveolatus]|uniref:pentatricopeptide repeat protein n=1 Tax=Aspergillus foveolatus TaxID=210207 RepID=UPI003CCDF316
MLRPVIRGARWYQHVARSSSSAASPRSFTRAFTAAAPRSIDYGGPNDKIKFYEQDTRRSTKRRRIDPEAEDNAEKEEVARELSQLDHELESLKEDPFGPNSSFIQSLPEDERAIALEALRKQEAKDGKDEPITFDDVFDEELDNLLKEEFGGLALEEENWMKKKDGSPQEVIRQPYEMALGDSENGDYIDRFNRALKRFAADKSSEKASQDLWNWYRGCKQIIPHFVSAIPEEAMMLLWSSQTSVGQHAARIRVLAEDALLAGRSLPTAHVLSYITSLQQLGKTREALDQWEMHQDGLSQQKEDLEAYWKLGVQLFTAEGNPQRAQDIALAFMKNDNFQHARILIPIIIAWGRQSGKEADSKLWALYLQLKAMLRHKMTMDDYDQISIGLLKAGKLDLAIAVFKDMMVTGKDSANDSTALYTAALGLAGNLQASAVSEQDVNKVSLSTLTVLPRRFENRFFYASWLKKLIGMGEVDSAALVIELMYERGVRPDPKHLNGLIAGWLREGSAPAREKAEELGWSMIKQRIDRFSKAEAKDSAQSEAGRTSTRIPKFMQRPMPAATIETFSILLLHYTRRGDQEAVEHLVKNLTLSRIQPNSYFMNHLLYAELRKQDIGALWNKFQVLSSSVHPDLETYACLWDCGKLQYDRSRTAYFAEFPTARALYSNMIAWFSNLSTRAQTTAREDFSKDLYDQIVRCFCLSKDLAGTLVALCSLHSTFGFHPDETTARLIILQVARLAAVPSDTPKRRLRRISSTPHSKANIAQVQQLVELLSDRKSASLESRGLTISSLDPYEKETHQLEIMTDLLRIVMSRADTSPNQTPDRNRVEEQLCTVAEEMGVPGIYLGPRLDDENAGLVSLR